MSLLLPFIHLYNQLTIWIMDRYFRLWVLTPYYYIYLVAQIFPVLPNGSPLIWLMRSLTHPVIVCVCVCVCVWGWVGAHTRTHTCMYVVGVHWCACVCFEGFLLSDTTVYSMLILCNSWLGIKHFSKEAYISSLENSIRKQYVGKCISWLWDIIASSLVQMAKAYIWVH